MLADVVHAPSMRPPYRTQPSSSFSSLFDMTPEATPEHFFFQLCAPPMQNKPGCLLPLIYHSASGRSVDDPPPNFFYPRILPVHVISSATAMDQIPPTGDALIGRFG